MGWSDAYEISVEVHEQININAVLTRYIPFAELIPMLGVTPEFGENSTLRNFVEYLQN